jgi:DNA-binding CsgD family transcriptional regulator
MVSDYGLTRREEEVLRCILSGMDNGAICEKLSISRNTLYKHNNSIFQKCGVASRWELLQLDR